MPQVITSDRPLVRASTPNETAINPEVAANVNAARHGLACVVVAAVIALIVPDCARRSSWNVLELVSNVAWRSAVPDRPALCGSGAVRPAPPSLTAVSWPGSAWPASRQSACLAPIPPTGARDF
jgi:hypothetical protein